MNKVDVTQKRLKELFSYSSQTGEFRRRSTGKVIGSRHCKGYIVFSVDKRLYLAHRLAFIYQGLAIDGQVDHINHDKTDNRLENLRIVNNKENHRNLGVSKANTSGVNGVSMCKKRGKWRTRIMVNGVDKSLGYFDKLSEAVAARLKANKEYGFHENHGKLGAEL